MDWFLYDKDLRHEKLKNIFEKSKESLFDTVKILLNFRAYQFVKKIVSIIVAFVKFSILLKAVTFKNKDK